MCDFQFFIGPRTAAFEASLSFSPLLNRRHRNKPAFPYPPPSRPACMHAPTFSHSLQTIGQTTKTKLNDDVERTYPGLILSSTNYEGENVRNVGLAYSLL